MNKKGFTLIEVIISLALVSMVIVSMLASLVKVKEAYTVVYENSDALIYSSTIARVINNDLSNNGGIKYVNCDLNGNTCDLVLGNDKKRKLEVYNIELGTNQAGKSYINPIDNVTKVDIPKETDIYCEKIHDCYYKTEDGIQKYVCNCNNKIMTSVLKYSDSSSNKIIYIKTLKLKKLSNYTNDGTLNKESTLGYTFGKIIPTIKTYNSVNKMKKDKTPYINSIVYITIQLYDGIDKNDSSYNVSLYSTSSYPPDSIRLGDEIKLRLDSGEEETAEVKYDEIVLKYGVGFYVYTDVKDASGELVGEKRLTPITVLPSIPVGIANDGQPNNRKFLGYWTVKGENEIQVISETGEILVSNKFFNSKTNLPILTAKWG